MEFARSLLHDAVKEGRLGVVKFWIEAKNMNPSEKDQIHKMNALHWAAASGHLEIVVYLVETRQMDVYETDGSEYHSNALHIAAGAGRLAVVKYLIEHKQMKQSIKDDGEHKRSALHWAAAGGHLEVVVYLVETRQMDVYEGDGSVYHHNALHIAAWAGQLAVVKYLIEQNGIDQSIKDDGIPKMNALHWAAAGGHLEVVVYLVETRQMDVYEGDGSEYQRNALHRAAGEGQLAVVKYLIEHKQMEQSVKDDGIDKMNALHMAAACGHLEVVVYLVETRQMDVYETDGSINNMNALHWAAALGHLEVVVYLVETRQMDVYVADGGLLKANALHMAADRGHLEVVVYLVETRQMDVYVADGGINKRNALHWAATHGRLEVVVYLVETRQMDVYVADGGINKMNALHLAADGGHLEVVVYLVETRQMDVSVADGGVQKRNALHLACLYCRVEVIKYLINIMDVQDLGFCTNDGDTALHCVLKSDENSETKITALKVLLEKPLDLNVKNKEGQTPIDIALLNKEVTIVLFLMENGADASRVEQSQSAQKIFEGKISQSLLEQTGNASDFSWVDSADSKTVNTVKVVMLGSVRAGKTSIVKSLMAKEMHLVDDGEASRTVGVDISEVEIDNYTKLLVYDYGGHDSYYYTHHLYITPKTLYIIVVDSENFDINQCQETLQHWYTSVSQRGVSPIFIIVCTKADLVDEDRISRIGNGIMDHLKKFIKKEEYNLKENLEKLKKEEDTEYKKDRGDRIRLLQDNMPVLLESFVSLSVKDEESLRKFEQIIKATISKNSGKLPFMEIPTNWFRIMEKVKGKKTFIKLINFNEQCTKQNVVNASEQKEILRHLCSIGQILHYGNFAQDVESIDRMRALRMQTETEKSSESRQRHEHHLSNIIFTEPEWIGRILGEVQHHGLISANPQDFINHHDGFIKETDDEKETIVQRVRKGLMSFSTIKSLIGARVEEEMVETIIDLFLKLDVCYKLKSENNLYCFPGLLREEISQADIESEWPVICPEDQKEYNISVSNNTSSVPSGFFEKISIRTSGLLCIHKHARNNLIATITFGDEGEKAAFIQLKVEKATVLLSLRLHREYCKDGRNILLSMINTIQYTTLFYPSVIFSIHVSCNKCVMARAKEVQKWRLEEITSPKSPRAILSHECQMKHGFVRKEDVFPTADETQIIDEEIARHIGCDWQFIFRHLVPHDLSSADSFLDGLGPDESILYQKVLKMLNHWRQKYREHSTTQSLFVALRKLERNDICDLLKEKIGVPATGDMASEEIEHQRHQAVSSSAGNIQTPALPTGEIIKIEEAEKSGRAALAISSMVGRDWREFGRYLFEDMPETFENFEKEHAFKRLELREISYQLLRRWRQVKGSGATVTALKDVLEKIEWQDIKDKLDTLGLH